MDFVFLQRFKVTVFYFHSVMS